MAQWRGSGDGSGYQVQDGSGYQAQVVAPGIRRRVVTRTGGVGWDATDGSDHSCE